MQAKQDNRWNLTTRILAALACLLTASCAGFRSTPTALMDFAMDTGGAGMLYAGTARIPRGFHSPESFAMEVEAAGWSGDPQNEASRRLRAQVGRELAEEGVYQPLTDDRGVLSLEHGRLLLRGRVSKEGQVLAGDWFYDGEMGGSFRIAPRGEFFLDP